MLRALSLPKGYRKLSAAAALSVAAFIMLPPGSAFALSAIPPAEGEAQPEAVEPAAPVDGASDDGMSAEEELLESDDSDRETLIEKVAPLVEKLTGGNDADISHDVTGLPEPVARLRELIVKAASTGDLKGVVALMNPGPDQTSIGVDTSGNDLKTALMDMSGDQNGMEILAIMLDILDSGYAHIAEGTAEEAYVWPYFVRRDINALTPQEEVELMRIVTAGDYIGMREFGGYNFYRIGISPDGRWRFFVAGD